MRYSRPGHSEDIPDAPVSPPRGRTNIELRIASLLVEAHAAGVPEADLEAGIDIAEAAVKALIEDRK